jgi:hypothetical protein
MAKRFVGIVVGLVALVGTATQAQTHMEWGVNAGLSMFHETATQGSASISNDTKTGLVAGAVLDIWILNILALEPGIAYSMRGGQFSMGTSGTGKENLAYLAIPFHGKVKWPGIPVLSPYALAGLNLGILLSAKADDGTTSEDFSSNVNPLAFGLDFGAGLDFDLPGIVPYIEFVYDLGVSNLAKNAPSDASMTTSGSEIKAGIRFKL